MDAASRAAERRMIMGLCENCKITMCRAERDDVIGCAEFDAKDTNVLTNADRIRAMSDEELATELLPLFEALCEDGIPSPEYMRFWLKQPMEGE